MGKGYNVESDHVAKSEYQCVHCGGWINKKGLPPDGKERTTRKVYCQYCDTAAKRKAMDEENKKLLKTNETTRQNNRTL